MFALYRNQSVYFHSMLFGLWYLSLLLQGYAKSLSFFHCSCPIKTKKRGIQIICYLTSRFKNECDINLIIEINQFSTNIPLLYLLKTSENFRFLDAFRGYRSEKLIEYWLNRYLFNIWHQDWINVLCIIFIFAELKTISPATFKWTVKWVSGNRRFFEKINEVLQLVKLLYIT